jgi:hypothetical protein
MKPIKPIIVLAFTNDNDDYLDMIKRERKNIFKTLQSHNDKGYVQVHKEESTSIDDIFDLFNLYTDRIAIFHYGGHANGTHLQLETMAGESQLADARGLAQLMGQQKELQLVFLNGCATWKQMDILLSAGVKSVIATSVPIDDKMATEFAEQFYNALASQAPLKKAFQIARAFIMSKYGPAKPINFYTSRDISWEGKEAETKQEVAWGLYSNENTPEVLDWKLPTTNQDSIIIRDSAHVGTNCVQVNNLLTDILRKEVVQYSTEVGYLLEAYIKSDSIDIRVIRQAIVDSFPSPVGEQLRRLFAIDTIDDNRLLQLVITYKTIIELLCFTMLSQLWEEKFKNPGLVIHEDYLVEFNSFFALSRDNYQTYNYIRLIEAITGIFNKNSVEYFIEELSNLGKSLMAKDEFYKAHLFMEEMKRELAEDNVKANEIENFCVQAEEHLSTILKHLAFFVKYKFITVKRIEVIKYRHKVPRFHYEKVLLDRVTAGISDDDNDTYDTFTDNNSVIILKQIRNVAEYLSLSPFIIDENALTGSKNSKLFFYSFQDTLDRNYYYKFIDNEVEQLIVSDNKYSQVKEQFEEFKENLFMESGQTGGTQTVEVVP